MSQEPKVTRFGALPTVDAELATKAYVDASSGGASPRSLISLMYSTVDLDAIRFCPLYCNLVLEYNSPTEGNVDQLIPFAFQVQNHFIVCDTNNRGTDTEVSFRDDGADVAAVTITASTTGDFDSGALTTNIAINSRCNFRVETPNAAGTIRFATIVTIESQ